MGEWRDITQYRPTNSFFSKYQSRRRAQLPKMKSGGVQLRDVIVPNSGYKLIIVDVDNLLYIVYFLLIYVLVV